MAATWILCLSMTMKTSAPVSDPVNGVSANAKRIPGGVVRYCLLVSNTGPLAATSIVVSDPIPTDVTFIPGSMRSGSTCAGASTVEDDNNAGADEADPDGASFATGNLIAVRANLASGTALAITFDATVN